MSNEQWTISIAPGIPHIAHCSLHIASHCSLGIWESSTNGSWGARTPARSDGISHSDGPGADHFSQHALVIVEHQAAQTGAERVHFRARGARRVDAEKGFPHFHLQADEG